jgi:hypothetical protein
MEHIQQGSTTNLCIMLLPMSFHHLEVLMNIEAILTKLIRLPQVPG